MQNTLFDIELEKTVQPCGQVEPIVIPTKSHQICGVMGREKRPKSEYYPTPPHATKKLINVEKFNGTIWEPACGEGYISKVFLDYGYKIISSDLYDYNFGESGIDFLKNPIENCVDCIVTNPPYKKAREFCETALFCAKSKVAMLLKINFLEGVTRQGFFKNTPFARIYVFSRRISPTRLNEPMTNKGMITYAWFIWEHGYKKEPVIRWV